MTTPPTRITLAAGKYTIVFGGKPLRLMKILHRGKSFLRRPIDASDAWIAAACEIEELREKVVDLEDRIATLEPEDDEPDERNGSTVGDVIIRRTENGVPDWPEGSEWKGHPYSIKASRWTRVK